MIYTASRHLLPPEERTAVTDEELRCASHVSDEEFRERIGMDELFAPRMNRGRTGYKVEGVE